MMESRICDVPIDLDEESSRFSISISRDLIERAISTAVSLKTHNYTSWSSSSGSCYDEEDATTSPIDLGGKWYWNSPIEDSSTCSQSDTSSDTHDSGYLSRSNSLEKRSDGVAGLRMKNDSQNLNQVRALMEPTTITSL